MQNVIINNRESLVSIQCQPEMHGKNGAPVPGRIIHLVPGANLINADDYAKLREKNSHFTLQFNEKIPRSPAPEQNPEKVGLPYLQIMETDKDGKKVPIVVEDKSPLAKLRGDLVQRIVDEVLAVSLLRAWLAEEVRPDIALALNRRIAELEADPEGGPAASTGR